LQAIIMNGVAEGCFDVPDAGLAAEVILALSQGRRGAAEMAIRTADAGDFDEAVRILSARMEAESGLLDRLLGVPAGSIRLSDPAECRMMLRAIVGRDAA
jgi:hypothetical protein